ncbi:MAG: TolC family protein [Capsulimonadaceae bacterium]|nr:TolC family protein [Capsulimonadaceae bacterium]
MKHICLIALALLIASATARAQDLPNVRRSLSLADAVALGRTYNLDLRASQADLAIANGIERSARAQAQPSASATTYGTVGDSANILSSAAGVAPQNLMTNAPKGFADQNVTVMVPLSTGGRIMSGIRAAMLRAKAAGLSEESTRIAVGSLIAQSYIRAQLTEALADVASARVKEEDEQVRETTAKVETGRLARVDLLREEAALQDAKREELAAINDAEQAIVDLKTAIGIDLSSQIVLTDPLDAPQSNSIALPSTLEEATRVAESQRPELASQASVIEAARADASAVKAGYSPQVYAFGMGDATSSQGDGRTGYTVGLAASMPLFDGGQRKADIAAADSRTTRAQIDALKMRQQIAREAASAWLSLRTAAAQADAALKAVAAAQEGYELAKLRYDSGKSTLAERLDAQTALSRAQGAMSEAQAAVATQRTVLLAAIGADPFAR